MILSLVYLVTLINVRMFFAQSKLRYLYFPVPLLLIDFIVKDDINKLVSCKLNLVIFWYLFVTQDTLKYIK